MRERVEIEAAEYEERQRQDRELAAQARKAGPSLLANVVAVVAGLAALLSGRTTIAIQHVERPHDEREDAGLGQWDSYVKVIPADDDEPAGSA